MSPCVFVFLLKDRVPTWKTWKMRVHLKNLENHRILKNLIKSWKNQGSYSTWKNHGIFKNVIKIMETFYDTWKNCMVIKNFPLAPDLEAPIYNYIIRLFFKRNSKPHFPWHEYCLPISFILTKLGFCPIFHLMFNIMYILAHYIDSGYEQSCV